MSDDYDKWMYRQQVNNQIQQEMALRNQELQNHLNENQAKMNDALSDMYKKYAEAADKYAQQVVPYTSYTTSSANGTDSLTETKIKELLDKLMPNKHKCPNCGKEVDGDMAYHVHVNTCRVRPPEPSSPPKKTAKPIKDLENMIDGLYE